MKTREKSLFAIGLLVSLGVGFVIGISVDFPKPNQSELAGTFGKADKFRKVQMTQKDVQLRSELLKDTAQLKSMIQGLVYFSLCTQEVSDNIDLCILAFKAQGIESQAGGADKISALQDYSAFIRNNNKTLNATIGLLTSFYRKDSTSQSQDVEKNLRDFASYVNSLNEKNQVLSQALSSFDNFMLTNKVLQAHKTEIIQLKSIRDKLLIKGIQLGAALSNKEQIQSLIVSAFGSQEEFRAITARDESMNASAQQAAAGLQVASLNAALYYSPGLNVAAAFSTQDLSGAVVAYNVSSHEFVYSGKPELNVIVLANPDLKVVAAINAQSLNVLLSNYSLQDVVSAMPGRFDAAVSMNIFSMADMQAVFTAVTGIAGLNYVLANENLGYSQR